MIVRNEDASDHASVRRVAEAAFPTSLEADLVDRLRADGDAVISLVAVEGRDIVGHVLFSRMSAPFLALGLAPVAVWPSHQGRGIGSRMIVEGLDRARSAGWDSVFVLGDPRYYRRFGFDPDLARSFKSPYAGPYLMALVLGHSLPVRAGAVEFAPAFGS